ncbi:MAG: hypothetical protein QW707_05120, partial [Candidatus Bathyarchaeia archaeon]
FTGNVFKRVKSYERHMSGERYIQIPNMLAVLAYDGDYHYIDRLGNSHAKSLALHYLREALRDFISLKRSPPSDMPNVVKSLMHSIDDNFLEYEVESIRNLQSTQQLREILSLICAKALAKTSKFIVRPETGVGSGVQEGEGVET